MIQMVGKDPNGVPRVWAEDETLEWAIKGAWKAAEEYLRARPDTGPLHKWTVVETAP